MTGKARTEFTREFLAHALRAGDTDIPDDAEVVGVEYHAERDIFECVLTSDEFPETAEGVLVRELHEVTGDE